MRLIVTKLRSLADASADGLPHDAFLADVSGPIVSGMAKEAADTIEQQDHALRLLLADVDMLVQEHGFSSAERDSMLSVKTARELLNI